MNKNKPFVNVILTIIVLLSLGGLGFLVYFNIDKLINDYQLILLFIVLIIFLIALVWLISRSINSQRRKMIESMNDRLSMWNNISYRVKKAGEIAFNNLPIGILVIHEKENKVLWSNQYAKDIFKSNLEDLNIDEFNTEFSVALKKCQEDQQSGFIFTLYDEIYQIEYVRKHSIIYLKNITEQQKLQTKYHNRTIGFGYIEIDNFENAFKELDIQERSTYVGKIIQIITDFFSRFHGYIRALTDKRFLLVIEQKDIEMMLKTDLSVLDEIKNLSYNNMPLHVTLSVGIACADEELLDVEQQALDAFELALIRGGNQAVIDFNGERNYYGAKEINEYDDTKVEIRNHAESLQEVFKSSSKVFVMAHKNTDTDGFGASVALYKMAQALNVESYIILDSVDTTVKKIVDVIKHDYVELKDSIISPNDAMRRVDRDSLLMIVDFQSVYQSPNSASEIGHPNNNNLLKKFKNIAVIDHHRRGEAAINANRYYYVKSTASSSVEIVMELCEFWPEKVIFTPMEATWLLLGIIVDTNNFLYRTSDKTFEIAGILKKSGAEMNEVQRYLKSDIEEFNNEALFMNNIRFYHDNMVAIAIGPDNKYFSRTQIAKVSDRILDIDNVELGITMAYLDKDTLGLSARSLGRINAQRIMELIGGGGHFNNAAAQVKNASKEEVISRLLKAINDNINNDDKIKIIFKETVKNVANRNDIKTFDRQRANRFLMDEVALLATQENIILLTEEGGINKNNNIKYSREPIRYKKILESEVLTIKVPLKDGVMSGSIDEIALNNAIYKAMNINLKTKQIELASPITKYGRYTINISLSREYTAKLVVDVTEE